MGRTLNLFDDHFGVWIDEGLFHLQRTSSSSSTDKFNSVGSDADLFGREPIHSLFSTFAILFMAQTVLCWANLTQNLIQQVRSC